MIESENKPAGPAVVEAGGRESFPARVAGMVRGLGPGLITASVVIGPGSIVVSSRLGASAGYSLIWALLIAGSFMLLFTAMGTRVGVCNRGSLLTIAAHRYGRWLSVLVGVSAFIVTAAFQSANYLACTAALSVLTGGGEKAWMIGVGVAALVFIFCARRLYKLLERVMTLLVAVMLLAFLVNLVVARPSLTGIVSGLVPRGWPLEMTGLMVAMTATTFSVIAALYQSTLAQEKGWREENLRDAVRGSLRGVSALLLATLMIMVTSAAVLRDADIQGAADLAAQLEPLLGTGAVIIFTLGFLAAAFSSTVVNAMVGGGLLADGLGLRGGTDSLATRLLTAVVMLVGWSSGIYFLTTESMVEGIIVAQQTTILAVPLGAALLVMMANDTRVVGEQRNGWLANMWSGVALLVLLGMSVYRLIGLFQG